MDPPTIRVIADELCHAAVKGHLWTVTSLIRRSLVDPTVRDNFAIRHAALHGHTDIVSYLLTDPRVDPAATTNFAINNACRNGHFSVAKLLLADPRVNPTVFHCAALRYACAGGYVPIVDLLLKDGRSDPNVTYNKQTPLSLSVKYGHTAVTALLLSDVRVQPHMHNNDALFCAATYGRTEIILLLLSDRRVLYHQNLPAELTADIVHARKIQTGKNWDLMYKYVVRMRFCRNVLEWLYRPTGLLLLRKMRGGTSPTPSTLPLARSSSSHRQPPVSWH